MIISIIICLPLMFLWGLKYKYLAYYYWHRWSLIWEYYWRSLFMSNFISWKSTVHIINSVVLWSFLKQNIWKINFCANPSFHWKMNWRIKFFFPLKNELENKILLFHWEMNWRIQYFYTLNCWIKVKDTHVL